MGILKLLKKLFKTNEEESTKKNSLAFLCVGDVIWARRYKTDEEKERIEEGHRESPFVIIYKSKNNVYALQCTSNAHKEINWRMILYPLEMLNYKTKKKSYVMCSKIYKLNKNQYVKLMGHLNDYDLNMIKKHVYILSNSTLKLKPNIDKINLDYKITKGDIILRNKKKYYIDFIEDNKLYTYQIRKQFKDKEKILINNTFYSFIFESVVVIETSEKYDLIDTFNKEEISLIKEYKKSFIKGTNKSLNIGDLINYNKCMYYVQRIDNNDIYAYRVYDDNNYISGMYIVKVNKKIYYTYYCTIKLNKQSIFKRGCRVEAVSSKEEIKYNNIEYGLNHIKKNKKKKVSYNEYGNKDITQFIPMSVLQSEINKEYYLVISKEDSIIELVNINNLGDTFYFEIDDKSPYKFSRTLSQERFDEYINKIKEFKDTVSLFDK